MIAALLLLALARADDDGDGDDDVRELQFTAVSDAAPIPKGEREIELHTTFAPGGPDGYKIDWRGEIELPISRRVQAAAYLDLASGAHPFDGVSYEVKGTVLSPLTAPIGLALYGEVSVRPDEFELEGKVILDKRFGYGALVYNGAVERAWTKGIGGGGSELAVGNELAVATQVGVSPLSVGVEASAPYAIAGDASTGALFAGPAVGVSFEPSRWAVTAAALPRLVTFGPGAADSEPWQVRAILSVEL